MRTQAESELGDDFEHFSDEETYFVDFLREPPEPTGEEPEGFSFEPPKIYEEMPRYVTHKQSIIILRLSVVSVMNLYWKKYFLMKHNIMNLCEEVTWI